MFGPPMTIYTIGHSTRTFAEFHALLGEHGIQRLVDIRRFPTSQRVPWATASRLDRELPARTIEYEHLVDLGGYRKPGSDSENAGWKSPGFRGYADHMATREFNEALGRLLGHAAVRRTALMCAEAVPWKCHRSLLSDALLANGVSVIHILGPHATQPHRMTEFAKVHGGRVTYPAGRKKVV